ncbi:hypothetical protein [Chryseolinea lacunae]|uniref:DUF4834 domain-containing protein n=1 Tax=Chryseolinea lacunae TaxID=2801331 RepID=A0ABS1KPU3_9BACT|nr:hypothetical protein [Chryseolinea lacunae]MBL0741498.1 hypothetical protein [Chryseolinea lacunae]
MYKFLIVVFLVSYVIYKVGGLFFRAGAASQQFRNQQQPKRSFDPNEGTAKKRTKGDAKAGEYIDYEEIK